MKERGIWAGVACLSQNWGVIGGGWGLLGGDKRVLLDGMQHVQELDLGGERVAVVDDGEIVWAIPAVH